MLKFLLHWIFFFFLNSKLNYWRFRILYSSVHLFWISDQLFFNKKIIDSILSVLMQWITIKWFTAVLFRFSIRIHTPWILSFYLHALWFTARPYPVQLTNWLDDSNNDYFIDWAKSGAKNDEHWSLKINEVTIVSWEWMSTLVSYCIYQLFYLCNQPSNLKEHSFLHSINLSFVTPYIYLDKNKQQTIFRKYANHKCILKKVF